MINPYKLKQKLIIPLAFFTCIFFQSSPAWTKDHLMNVINCTSKPIRVNFYWRGCGSPGFGWGPKNHKDTITIQPGKKGNISYGCIDLSSYGFNQIVPIDPKTNKELNYLLMQVGYSDKGKSLTLRLSSAGVYYWEGYE
ncbi:MAG: hypothetical protein OXC48_08125 [Endozoicomonadaceae bacterium]|nr:hypothetical protein [Endozoicomonadaceae bacterium]